MHNNQADLLNQTQVNMDLISDCLDAIVPSIQALRNNAGVSEGVNYLLALYEGTVQADVAQSK